MGLHVRHKDSGLHILRRPHTNHKQACSLDIFGVLVHLLEEMVPSIPNTERTSNDVRESGCAVVR